MFVLGDLNYRAANSAIMFPKQVAQELIGHPVWPAGLAQVAATDGRSTAGPCAVVADSTSTSPSSADTAATDLDFYLGQALQNSPLLKDYHNQVLTGEVDSQLVRASYRPQVNGNSTNIYAPSIHGWGYDQAISNGGNFTTVAAVTQTLIGKQHLDAQYETIRLQETRDWPTVPRVSQQDLKKSITAQYIVTYGDLQQLTFNRDIYDLLQKELPRC